MLISFGDKEVRLVSHAISGEGIRIDRILGAAVLQAVKLWRGSK